MKKIFLILGLLLVVLSLSGCHIKDTNGDEVFDLETISDEDILNGTNISVSFSYNSYIGNKGKFGASKLSGVKDIDTLNASNQDLKIVFTSKVTSGNFKLVVIHDEIIDIIPINQEYEYIVSNAIGKYVIKVAGESAKFEITYEYNIG